MTHAIQNNTKFPSASLPSASLQKAIEESDLKAMQSLLKQSGLANTPFSSKELPLHAVVRSTKFLKSQDQIEAAKLLIQSGANFEKDIFGLTALDHAIHLQNMPLAKAMIAEKAGIASEIIKNQIEFKRSFPFQSEGLETLNQKIEVDPTRLGALQKAAYTGNLEELKKAKIAGINQAATQKRFNQLDQNGFAPIHYAVLGNQEAAFQTLLTLGADPKILTRDKESIIHLAAIHPSSFLLRKTLNVADINFPNSRGDTPLHYAFLKERWETIQTLMQKGADPLISNLQGISPPAAFLSMSLQKDPLLISPRSLVQTVFEVLFLWQLQSQDLASLSKFSSWSSGLTASLFGVLAMRAMPILRNPQMSAVSSLAKEFIPGLGLGWTAKRTYHSFSSSFQNIKRTWNYLGYRTLDALPSLAMESLAAVTNIAMLGIQTAGHMSVLRPQQESPPLLAITDGSFGTGSSTHCGIPEQPLEPFPEAFSYLGVPIPNQMQIQATLSKLGFKAQSTDLRGSLVPKFLAYQENTQLEAPLSNLELLRDWLANAKSGITSLLELLTLSTNERSAIVAPKLLTYLQQDQKALLPNRELLVPFFLESNSQLPSTLRTPISEHAINPYAFFTPVYHSTDALKGSSSLERAAREQSRPFKAKLSDDLRQGTCRLIPERRIFSVYGGVPQTPPAQTDLKNSFLNERTISEPGMSEKTRLQPIFSYKSENNHPNSSLFSSTPQNTSVILSILKGLDKSPDPVDLGQTSYSAIRNAEPFNPNSSEKLLTFTQELLPEKHLEETIKPKDEDLNTLVQDTPLASIRKSQAFSSLPIFLIAAYYKARTWINSFYKKLPNANSNVLRNLGPSPSLPNKGDPSTQPSPFVVPTDGHGGCQLGVLRLASKPDTRRWLRGSLATHLENQIFGNNLISDHRKVQTQAPQYIQDLSESEIFFQDINLEEHTKDQNTQQKEETFTPKPHRINSQSNLEDLNVWAAKSVREEDMSNSLPQELLLRSSTIPQTFPDDSQNSNYLERPIHLTIPVANQQFLFIQPEEDDLSTEFNPRSENMDSLSSMPDSSSDKSSSNPTSRRVRDFRSLSSHALTTHRLPLSASCNSIHSSLEARQFQFNTNSSLTTSSQSLETPSNTPRLSVEEVEVDAIEASSPKREEIHNSGPKDSLLENDQATTELLNTEEDLSTEYESSLSDPENFDLFSSDESENSTPWDELRPSLSFSSQSPATDPLPQPGSDDSAYDLTTLFGEDNILSNPQERVASPIFGENRNLLNEQDASLQTTTTVPDIDSSPSSPIVSQLSRSVSSHSLDEFLESFGEENTPSNSQERVTSPTSNENTNLLTELHLPEETASNIPVPSADESSSKRTSRRLNRFWSFSSLPSAVSRLHRSASSNSIDRLTETPQTQITADLPTLSSQPLETYVSTVHSTPTNLRRENHETPINTHDDHELNPVSSLPHTPTLLEPSIENIPRQSSIPQLRPFTPPSSPFIISIEAAEDDSPSPSIASSLSSSIDLIASSLSSSTDLIDQQQLSTTPVHTPLAPHSTTQVTNGERENNISDIHPLMSTPSSLPPVLVLPSRNPKTETRKKTSISQVTSKSPIKKEKSEKPEDKENSQPNLQKKLPGIVTRSLKPKSEPKKESAIPQLSQTTFESRWQKNFWPPLSQTPINNSNNSRKRPKVPSTDLEMDGIPTD